MLIKKTNLLLDVVERVGRVNGKADQNNVGIGIRKRAKAVVVFLTGRIPEGKLDMLAINFDVGDVVLEDGGNVDLLCRVSLSAGMKFIHIMTRQVY